MYCYLNRIDCKFATANGCCDSTACHNYDLLNNIGSVNNYIKDSPPAKEEISSPWHTGLPTEEGMYLCYQHQDGFFVEHWDGNSWFEYDQAVDAWQKIEPFTHGLGY